MERVRSLQIMHNQRLPWQEYVRKQLLTGQVALADDVVDHQLHALDVLRGRFAHPPRDLGLDV